ncbi:hypothetical protein H9L12_08105 [Sphingomonas rhizophila]|uniref:Uncharacterized protein n=1 Tax=Sphingomonas rhizophila TaxID=2071607 RepID=A0A7G9S8Y3_9SPHN|nr:DUF5985 family protein [Sphingomonas rhizophila]QNN64308.1 hypothetical protein H9L12_08105 [Sphingomonas rhizophila]
MTEAFPGVVYVLCLLTSTACALLLARSYCRHGMSLLLWSSICFTFLAANNLVLVIDLLIWPDGDLRTLRASLALAASASLIWGVIWDTGRTAK